MGQGQVFNATRFAKRRRLLVAIPLGQGQVFNPLPPLYYQRSGVAIPLGQGQVFNTPRVRVLGILGGRNPFGSGTGF